MLARHRGVLLLILALGLGAAGVAMMGTGSGRGVIADEREQVGEETVMPSKAVKSDAEWRRVLTPEQYRVMREKGTEQAFTGKYVDYAGNGIYRCAACGNELFRSQEKFHSGTGWPSFTAPYEEGSVREVPDMSHGMMRTEIVCSHCGAHLGHVFDDGPQPTGQRYCINSVALQFADDRASPMASDESTGKTEKALFGAGCFWGVEAAFRRVDGVISTSVGYSGGTTVNPTYEDVCSGRTGHAEVVEVVYDPSRVSYGDLLDVFWSIHDPTQVNRQGPDIGAQYRSAIFYHGEKQKMAAEASWDRLQKSGRYHKRIATEIVPAAAFYPAEEYHQRYLEKHGQVGCSIR
jgi:peptide methionine sulfoxide reductase msrA/msrB